MCRPAWSYVRTVWVKSDSSRSVGAEPSTLELPDIESHEDHAYCQPSQDPDGNDRFECHAGIGGAGIRL